MFRTYYFSEMPYPNIPGSEFTDVIRTTMPNRWLDPDTTHDVYHKYFDLVKAADDLGLDVMFNEHHGTMANLNGPMPLTVAIAARETKNARLLVLGNPVANRPDPVRVATEMAMIDVVSRGRLDAGFIKGIFYELSATNGRPTDMGPRVYEAIDLIQKAWTTHDGPFNWEGEFFHHREVNIVPRPYQQPHPPIWVTTTSAGSIPPIAQRGFNMGTIFNGTEASKKLFAVYREVYEKFHGVQPHPNKLAYSGYCMVADSDAEALREAPKIQDFLKQSFRAPKGQYDVPGYLDPQLRAIILKAESEQPGSAFKFDAAGNADPRDLVDTGIAFYGTPDSVFEQLKTFFYAVGGFGHFMGMFQASTMTYGQTAKSMRMFAEQVLPRFREEVYDPWVKEQGFGELMLPRAETAVPLNMGAAAGLGSTRAA
jgi:alkanesulfonate monooxygenase SsuD/methylene tetrahydromethanopterin reductase-like flavin-dependent oxidoreductase (luciferase family)